LNGKKCDLHRIIAQQFIENPDSARFNVIDHIDHDRTNYHINNLRWTSYSANNRNKSSHLGIIYSYVDEIKSLPYPFTPHITLAYYSHDGFSAESKRKLENIVNILNKSKLTIEIDTDRLFYQKFTNMNTYANIFKL
jgi:hypothetical protein